MGGPGAGLVSCCLLELITDGGYATTRVVAGWCTCLVVVVVMASIFGLCARGPVDTASPWAQISPRQVIAP